MKEGVKPVLVATWHGRDKYFDCFMATAKKNGIEPQNADPNFWPGTTWQDKEWFRKTEAQYKYVLEHPEYTHYVFTDSYDIIFAAGLEEIVAKFLNYNSALVFGSESCPWPDKEQAKLYPATIHRSKYLNAGFWMGERDSVREFLAEASKRAAKRDRCDQGIFVDLFLSGKYNAKLDNSCSLLFCCNLNSLDYLALRNGRPTCTDTGESPCVFHGNGNSPLFKVVEMLS